MTGAGALGLPDTCAIGSRSTLTIKGESLGLHRKGEETPPKLGFLFKASWSGFILQEFFYLSEFGQQSPQQVLTGTTSWRSRKAPRWVSIAKMYFFNSQKFILLSWKRYCWVYLMLRKLMRPLESEPTNSTVGFPGVESRAVTIWQFFRRKEQSFFL